MNIAKKQKRYKILFTGGGTGGSVAPLLAIFDELKKNKKKYDFFWIGTSNGPEKMMVASEGIKFKSITCGKLRRYFSWENFIAPFQVFIGFWQSFFILLYWRPDIIISAGSFVSVPVAWAGWILRVPILIHQQDARPGLANKLMAPLAKVVTVTFAKSLIDYQQKAIWVGNFIREEIKNLHINKNEAVRKLGLRSDKLIVLVLGGSTGALDINKLIERNLQDLINFCQIIHITGRGKEINYENIENIKEYKSFEFLNTDGLIKVFAVADIVVSRCGMGLLSELSYLGKAALLIPMPDSHQEENAEIFSDQNAAIVLKQKDITNENFVANIEFLIRKNDLREKLGINIKKVIKCGNKEIIKIIKNIVKN